MTDMLKSSFLCELLDDDSSLLLLQNTETMLMAIQLNTRSVILKTTHSGHSRKDI